MHYAQGGQVGPQFQWTLASFTVCEQVRKQKKNKFQADPMTMAQLGCTRSICQKKNLQIAAIVWSRVHSLDFIFLRVLHVIQNSVGH